jgi:hypothetical protein
VCGGETPANVNYDFIPARRPRQAKFAFLFAHLIQKLRSLRAVESRAGVLHAACLGVRLVRQRLEG